MGTRGGAHSCMNYASQPAVAQPLKKRPKDGFMGSRLVVVVVLIGWVYEFFIKDSDYYNVLNCILLLLFIIVLPPLFEPCFCCCCCSSWYPWTNERTTDDADDRPIMISHGVCMSTCLLIPMHCYPLFRTLAS